MQYHWFLVVENRYHPPLTLYGRTASTGKFNAIKGSKLKLNGG